MLMNRESSLRHKVSSLSAAFRFGRSLLINVFVEPLVDFVRVGIRQLEKLSLNSSFLHVVGIL